MVPRKEGCATMRKETQLGLLAFGLVGCLFCCAALLVALGSRNPPGSSDTAPRTRPDSSGIKATKNGRDVASASKGAGHVKAAPKRAEEEDVIEPAEQPRGTDEDRPRLLLPSARSPRETPTAAAVAAEEEEKEEEERPAKAPAAAETQEEPAFDPYARPPQEGKLEARRGKKLAAGAEPIEVVRAYLTDRLSPGESLKVDRYGEPVPATLQRRRAAVLRVVYAIHGQAETKERDQLFLIQDGEVKQCVDY